METANIRQALQSKKFKKVITIFGIALIVLIIFAIGLEVGYMKAGYSYKFGESYYNSFGPDGAHPGGLIPGDVSAAHGVNGTIVSVSPDGLMIADSDHTEKAVRIDDDTIVRELRNTISPADLKVGDLIIVIGSPDANADIEAKFIRVIPQVPAAQAAPAAQPVPTTN